MGHQVALQRLELLAVFEADDVVVMNRRLRVDGRLLLVGRRLFGRSAHASERGMDVGDMRFGSSPTGTGLLLT